MSGAPWLSVIGLGEEGLAALAPAARALVANAETVVGGRRHLARLDEAGLAPAAERLAWSRPLGDTIDLIEARRGRRVVVLASGDPMWFGIGVTLARHFPPGESLVIPTAGAFSLAAARLGWAIADVEMLSLVGRPIEPLVLHLVPGARLLVLSENGESPAAVAAFLRAHGWGPSRFAVLEHLGGPAERHLEETAESWPHERTADLNTLAIECRPVSAARLFPLTPGLPDEAFAHDGQITKREVRAVTLAALAPLPGQLLWDVGAGAGSIAIEWLRAARRTRAVAIERNPARAAGIGVNAAILGVPRLQVVTGEAPAALEGLDPPDAIFLGGGVSAPAVMDSAWEALMPGGRLVANAVTLAGEAALIAAQARRGGALTRLAISRAEPVGGFLGWRALMPVTQWTAVKP